MLNVIQFLSYDSCLGLTKDWLKAVDSKGFHRISHFIFGYKCWMKFNFFLVTF